MEYRTLAPKLIRNLRIPYQLLSRDRRPVDRRTKAGLADIRNEESTAFPWSGLLELVRDLIEYAYRTDFAAL
jgi:hypothetical protein